MGDGKCENPDAWSESEYPYPKPHNVTVSGASCEFHQVVDPQEKDYVVIAKTAPDGKIVNLEYSYGEEKETALRHLDMLKRGGWRAEVELREQEAK